MSLFSFMGALEMGFIFALVALGVLLSFRILDFPDLTADGSFPLGGATAAVLIVAGWNPWLACLAAAAAGAAAGLLTAWLYVRLGIMQLLASILTMIALYSVNLRIMGAPNLSLLGEPSVFSPFLTDDNAMWARPLALGLVVLAVKLGLDGFFASQTGLALRATGANPRMARAQGVPTGRLTLGGMALSNALIALGGALYVHWRDAAARAPDLGGDAGHGAGCAGVPPVHRAGAGGRFHRPASARPEPGDGHAGGRGAGAAQDQGAAVAAPRRARIVTSHPRNASKGLTPCSKPRHCTKPSTPAR